MEEQKIPFGQISGRLEIHGGLFATLIGLDLIAQSLVLPQRHHARAFDRADMDEAVIAATIRCDETKTFVGVEKFNCAYGHDDVLFTKTE
jgi:hypothetical protein